MSNAGMVGSAGALGQALLVHLRGDALMRDVFGDVPRILNDVGGAKPLYPYMVIARHEVVPAHGCEVQIEDHVIDLHIMTRWAGRNGAREAMGDVLSVLENADISLEGHKLVWCYVAFSDVLSLRDEQTFKGVVRLKLRTTPLQ